MRSGNRCVKKMDHHCPWINHCVGWSNHAYFIYFLIFATLGSFHGGIILSCSFYRGIYRYWYIIHNLEQLATVNFTMTSIIMCILAMGFALGVVIALTMLLYFQVRFLPFSQIIDRNICLVLLNCFLLLLLLSNLLPIDFLDQICNSQSNRHRNVDY